VFMGEMLTKLIEDIVAGKTISNLPGGQRLKLGVDKLPEIAQDNTDRNRTSPFAFTGAKFEFRAVGSSASPAFPVMLLNAVVAESIGEITEKLREELKKTKKVEDAVLKVVREEFKESSPIRFEGNGYSQDWVHDAEKRGLLNLKRTPESLAPLVPQQTRALFSKLGILSKQELESRYHVRLERYAKDILIEAHTQAQVIDTMVLPAALYYASDLTKGVARAKAAGVKSGPQAAAANTVVELLEQLQQARETLGTLIAKADAMHDEPEQQARLLTKDVSEAMDAARHASDALELVIADERWPLPKYREMLFPV
jgi:glutamine synthetase